jgi:hypothetical protein
MVSMVFGSASFRFIQPFLGDFSLLVASPFFYVFAGSIVSASVFPLLALKGKSKVKVCSDGVHCGESDSELSSEVDSTGASDLENQSEVIKTLPPGIYKPSDDCNIGTLPGAPYVWIERKLVVPVESFVKVNVEENKEVVVKPRERKFFRPCQNQ